MKKLKFAVPVLVIILLAALSPASKRMLVDIVSNTPAAGFNVSWPETRYYMEPFSGAAEYMLSFTRYMIQLASWMFWLSAFALLIGFYKEQSLKEILLCMLKYEVCFISVVMMCLMLPFPAPRLESPKNYQVTDFHSHTFYSHDGLVSPQRSLYYHKRLGFDSFFDTEHGLTSGFSKFPQNTLLNTVFPGMQVSTTERVSLLVLADRPYDAEPFLHQSVKNVIDLAHKDGFIVVCPHWWKWRYFTWQQLYDFGIDGFEIYNAGYRNFSEDEREKLISFCKDKNLLMTGSTDWHGWGYLSNIWTAVENTAADKTLPFDALRKHLPTKVLVLVRPHELQNTFRYVFEPFFGFYYYFGSLNNKQVCYLLIWAAMFVIAKRMGVIKRLSRAVPAVLCAVFACLAVWSIIVWIPLLPENQVLGKLIAPVFLGIAAGWLLVFKFSKR